MSHIDDIIRQYGGQTNKYRIRVSTEPVMESPTDYEMEALESAMDRMRESRDAFEADLAAYKPIDWDELRADVKKAVAQVFAERDAELAKRLIPHSPVIHALAVMRSPAATVGMPIEPEAAPEAPRKLGQRAARREAEARMKAAKR